ncbi:flagellar transcriptional regulator FlhC [Cupriavidus sp. WKF15]|uniref:flagellar transcriptional regulator FlhC n=1 Tax=Cupriavidus sp. WKF15 TaxID=3032282 RepID=UPI0023E1EBE2|nr:flagellar transcriptional regulator FlhC [Cupriavidus sp. WKF15]WER48506.1 flagellar transcriptional regulator FlhC [Cupriavidus sp. WKF15]
MKTTAQPAPARSALQDACDTQLAIELIGLGARPQVVEAEVALSRSRVYRLYRELTGGSPPKGMLPFSADWFVTWRPNAHASYLLSVHEFMQQRAGLRGIRAVLNSYRVYADHMRASNEACLISFTRFWTLVRFMDGGLLQLSTCHCCGGRYVTHAHEPLRSFVCSLCEPPSRVRRGVRRTPAAGVAEQAPPILGDLPAVAGPAFGMVPALRARPY